MNPHSLGTAQTKFAVGDEPDSRNAIAALLARDLPGVEVSPNRCRFCINPLPESQDESSSNILRRINPDYITVQDSLQPMQIKPALPLAIRMIPAWINNLRSQLVLLSVAANDRNGRTDQHGWIRIETDVE